VRLPVWITADLGPMGPLVVDDRGWIATILVTTVATGLEVLEAQSELHSLFLSRKLLP
jgi:hypothetical protein